MLGTDLKEMQLNCTRVKIGDINVFGEKRLRSSINDPLQTAHAPVKADEPCLFQLSKLPLGPQPVPQAFSDFYTLHLE